jgi:hypothetical protein
MVGPKEAVVIQPLQPPDSMYVEAAKLITGKPAFADGKAAVNNR